jgi:hypothetical protein
VTDTELILDAYKMLGVVPHVATSMDAGVQAVGQRTLRRLISSWATQSLTMYAWSRNTYPLQSGVSEYTLGPGGDFSQPVPLAIDLWSIIPNRNDAQLLELPRRRPLTIEQWQHIAVKETESSYPSKLYWDKSRDGSGRTTLTVYPVPNTDDADLVLYGQTAVEQMSPGTEYTFPDAYESALVNNLAVRLKTFYPDAQLDQSVYRLADTELHLLKRSNWTPGQLFDTAPWKRGGEYNIYTDDYEHTR